MAPNFLNVLYSNPSNLFKIKLVKLLNDINVVHIIAMTLQTLIMGLMKYGMTFF